MITHHYDHSSSQNLLEAKWSNYDLTSPFSPVTCTIIEQKRLRIHEKTMKSVSAHSWYSFYGSNMSGGRVLQGPLLWIIILRGRELAHNMQCASRDLQSASRFSINFKFCLKKVSFHQNDQIMIVPKLLKNFAHHYDQIMITHHYDHLVSPAFRMDKIGHYDRSF